MIYRLLAIATVLMGVHFLAAEPPIVNYIKKTSLDSAPRRYIITGGPGVGKTTLINYLHNMGVSVVHEAAADIIRAELAQQIEAPWSKIDFGEKVVRLQTQRQDEIYRLNPSLAFFDRSPIDAISYDIMYALDPATEVIDGVQTILDENFYNKTVFLIENLGAAFQTDVRVETLAETIKIERIIEANYRALGFDIVRIPAMSVEDRVKMMLSLLE